MFGNLWSRIKALFGRAFRREPAPGRFESGSKFSVHGTVGTAPLVWPSRDYLVYVPRGRSAWRRAPLVVLCHGCKQTPEEIAQGTRITELADRLGFVVLLPRQKEEANPWRCWNWFDKRTMNGNGEAAIVAAQIRRVRRAYRIDRKRILVAGMSAGGALAAIIGVRFPGLVSAVAVHSGIACGAASSAVAALSVAQRGPDQDVEADRECGARGGGAARIARAAAGHARRRAISVVAPRNAIGAGAAIPAPQRSPGGERQYGSRAACRPPIPNAASNCRRAHRSRQRMAARGPPRRTSYRDRWASAMRGAAAIPRWSTTTRGRRMPRRWSAISSPMHYPDGLKEEKRWPFPAMNHFTILTDDVPRTVDFYARLLGLANGPRPALGFPGAWLYAGDTACCTSSAASPRDQLRPGVIDHMAFTAQGLADTLAALVTYNIEHVCRRQVEYRLVASVLLRSQRRARRARLRRRRSPSARISNG